MVNAKLYQVPVVFPDLQPEESVMQFIDAIAYLSKVTNNVFDRLANRMVENQQRLDQLNSRLQLSQAKVQKLVSTPNKATTVFSSAKYLGPPKLAGYTPIFFDAPTALRQVRASDTSDLPDKQPRGPSEWRVDVPRELLARPTAPANKPPVDAVLEVEGLGRLPAVVQSVTDLLLFNTQDNPYKKYVSLDNLTGIRRKKEKESPKKRKLGDAPDTIKTGETMDYKGAADVKFKPRLENVPDMNLPDNLPNLRNLASDMQWSASDRSYMSQIAPTAVLDLPDVAQDAGPGGVITGVDLPAVANAGPAPVSSAGAPPPPPPPPSSFGGAPSGGPPPPPPPPPPPGVYDGGGMGSPPPPPPPPPPGGADGDGDGDDDGNGGGDDGGAGTSRNALLDAIRDKSKTKLKSHKDRMLKEQQEGKDAKKPKKAAAPPPRDIMADLREKLNKRLIAFQPTGGHNDDGEKGDADDWQD